MHKQFSKQSKTDGRSVLFGETPKTIRLRQFTEICTRRGYRSEIDFARAVIDADTTERLSMLIEYYKTKKYPDDSVESYSQIIQSSQDSNTRNASTENEQYIEKNSGANLVRNSRKITRRKTRFTKVLKQPFVKQNKSGRISKKCVLDLKAESKNEKMGIVKASIESKRSDDNIIDTTVNDKTKSLSNDLAVEDTLAVSLTNTKNICEDIVDELFTACSKTTSSATCTSAQPKNVEDNLQSSFLDEFLLECSNGTNNNNENCLSRYNTSPHETTDCAGKNENLKTSIIDDLI